MTRWKGTVARGLPAADFAEYCGRLALDERSWRPQFIVVHNTAIPTLADWHDVSGERRMRGLEYYYRDEQGWSGGPHLFVADDLIWVFTPLDVPGVHSPSWNAISWGVETVGDYNHEELPNAVLDNLVEALVALHRLGDFAAPAIRFHKEDPKTTHRGCPGRNLDKALLIDRLTVAL